MPTSAKATGLHNIQQGRTRTFWCAFLLRLGYDRVVVLLAMVFGTGPRAAMPHSRPQDSALCAFVAAQAACNCLTSASAGRAASHSCQSQVWGG